jgi:hypothetical protein
VSARGVGRSTAAPNIGTMVPVARPLLILLAATAAFAVAFGTVRASAQSDGAYPAVLAGHAILPALTLIDPPPDAPAEFRTSGKYADPPAAGDVAWPLAGQPAQGHSAIRRAADGSFWVLTDNGAGSKANSGDFMLHLNRYRVDFAAGEVDRLQTVFLRDPEGVAPFRIVTDGTAERYLTGADFDPESLAFAGGQMWIGDEFGPYLLRFDLEGRLGGVVETMVDGRVVRSPDHPAGAGSPEVARSKGLEALAGSPDGQLLYPMLEGPLAAESDPLAVRILEFELPATRWTGRHWTYPLEQEGNAIGGLTMIDATTALVIERDGGFGTADRACPAGESRTDCFERPARFKRVYKIEMDQARAGGPVRKIGYVDLMSIADPEGLARVPLTGGTLAFPFATIESVDVVDDRHIVVGNDNNLPYSRSRDPGRIDDNEWVLLEVAGLLGAR